MNYKSSNYFLFFTLLQFKICFVAAWYGQDAHNSYFLAFYFFYFLPFYFFTFFSTFAKVKVKE